MMVDKDVEDNDIDWLGTTDISTSVFNIQREVSLTKQPFETFGVLLASISHKSLVVGLLQPEDDDETLSHPLPAVRAGLEYGDQIVNLNGLSVGNACTPGIIERYIKGHEIRSILRVNHVNPMLVSNVSGSLTTDLY